MPYTYPPAGPTFTGETVTIHRLLQDPAQIAKRLRQLAAERFIADALLTGRYTAAGGSIQWEQDDDSLYTERPPEAIRPGGEYPMSPLGMGTTQIAEVQKWGQDVPVKDEAIKRLKLNPVDRAFNKLINHMVKTVDGIAMAAILSAVTNTQAARAVWTSATAKQIFLDVSESKAKIIDLGLGYDPDTVVVPTLTWVHAMATFADAGYLPREDNRQPVLTGDFPVIDGMRWLTTPFAPVSTAAMVLDSTALGGMADEDLGGPGYAGALAGIQTKSIRDEEKDGYRLRARRVTVPAVVEPAAARTITGVAA
ncbi:hypothetical protein [Pseudonocardia sp. NPDC049635]|uniref:phage major capsid protein n=1 Tax=Pseudonocardia sp. NPDC049635 TaxID=3155506 RepID=UPI0033C863AE